MKVIGLCGASGSGKGTVASYFSKYGIPSIDADAVYREMTLPGEKLTEELRLRFGNEIIAKDGSLDRAALAKIVFSEDGQDSLALLNSITHRAILLRTEELISRYEGLGYEAVLFDAPLLFESGFDKKCDVIIAVLASDENKIKRIVMRDKITAEAAKKRISTQKDNGFLINHSDFVIQNDAAPDVAEAEVKALIKKILNKEVN